MWTASVGQLTRESSIQCVRLHLFLFDFVDVFGCSGPCSLALCGVHSIKGSASLILSVTPEKEEEEEKKKKKWFGICVQLVDYSVEYHQRHCFFGLSSGQKAYPSPV